VPRTITNNIWNDTATAVAVFGRSTLLGRRNRAPFLGVRPFLRAGRGGP
jgi:hypothetical protein